MFRREGIDTAGLAWLGFRALSEGIEDEIILITE